MSCENDITEEETESNPFIGTWLHWTGEKCVITETVLTYYRSSGAVHYTGTYTYDEIEITVSVDAEVFPMIGDTVVLPYYFDDTLYIHGDPFTKVS